MAAGSAGVYRGQSHADSGDTARTPHRDRPLPRDRRRRRPACRSLQGYLLRQFRTRRRAPVLIGSAEPLTGCEVSPAARGIAASVEGAEARFTLPGAGWWVVRLNDRDRLFLLADEPEKAPAANGQTLNAADFVSGDGLQTANLQRALDEASATGRTLIFPRGVYPTGRSASAATRTSTSPTGRSSKARTTVKTTPPTAASRKPTTSTTRSATPTTASG